MMKSIIVFAVSMILTALLFNIILEYITKKNIHVNCGKHKNLEYAMINNMLYMIISSFSLLIFYELYEYDFFECYLSKIPHIKEILDSGLFTGLALVLVGILVKLFYLGFLKIIRCKVFLIELEENEQTWIMIVSCILLFIIGLENYDFIFAFSVLALIVAKFFWVINNSILKLWEEIKGFFKLPIYTIIFIVSILAILVIMVVWPQYLLQIIYGLTFGILAGAILYAIIHKDRAELISIEEIENGMKIKFRAWDKKRMTMEYIDDLFWFKENGVHNFCGEGHCSNYNFMTNSGMNDSKRTHELPEGQEVYEGDVIMDIKGNIYKVVFFNGKFIADAKSEIIGRKDLGLVISEKAYVVGNIYEKDTLKF